MPTFSAKRLIASVALIAAACLAFVVMGSGIIASGKVTVFKISLLMGLGLSICPLIGAGIGNLWKRPGDGAAIGLCIYLVVMVLSILTGN